MKTIPRSIKYLEECGYVAANVEKYNSFSRKKKDLYGFGDIVAFKPRNWQMVIVNSTTATNLAAHVHKYEKLQTLKDWLSTGHQFIIHSWGKRGARGKRKLWTLIERHMNIDEVKP